MNLQVRNALIGLGVTFGLSFLGEFAGGGAISIVPALVIGMFTWYFLSMQANNRTAKAMPDAERDAALALPPAQGTGLVYVYREGFMGRALGVDIVVDGSLHAQLKSPRCTRLVLSGGDHVLEAGPKGFAATQNKSASESFTLHEGETIVFALGFRAGMTQNTVTLDREPDSRAAVNKLRLIPMVPSDQSGMNSSEAERSLPSPR